MRRKGASASAVRRKVMCSLSMLRGASSSGVITREPVVRFVSRDSLWGRRKGWTAEGDFIPWRNKLRHYGREF